MDPGTYALFSMRYAAIFIGAQATALRWLYDPETPFESSPVMVWPK